jgi:hypothetical protein
MRRLSLGIVLVIAGALAFPAATGAQTPAQDFGVGSGTTPSGNSFDFTATSDPGGGSPTGTASWELFGTIHFEGTVSCLAVDGNRAVVGIDVDTTASPPGFQFQGFFLTVVDGGSAGSGLDSFDASPTFYTSVGNIVPTDCSVPVSPFFPERVTTGDIVVHDAPPFPTTKDQCTNGGWRNYPGFKNQGQCVSFVATGRKEPASGLSG